METATPEEIYYNKQYVDDVIEVDCIMIAILSKEKLSSPNCMGWMQNLKMTCIMRINSMSKIIQSHKMTWKLLLLNIFVIINNMLMTQLNSLAL